MREPLANRERVLDRGNAARGVLSVRKPPSGSTLPEPLRARVITRPLMPKPLITALCKSLFALFAPLLALLMLHFCAACDLVRGDHSLGGPSPPPSGSLSVSFIDVGQGDGVLVQAGGTNHLIDAGRPEEGPNVVDFLRARGVRELDGIVVSNPDADHIGGFLAVFEALEVERVYVSGDAKGTLTYNTFLRGVRDEGSEVEVVRSGRRLEWGGVRADVIAPPPGELFSETNDNSVAILLSYGSARVLLAGDAEAREEEYMANGPYTGPLTVVNVPKLYTLCQGSAPC